MSQTTGAKRKQFPSHRRWLSSLLERRTLVQHAIQGATLSFIAVLGLIAFALACRRIRLEITEVPLPDNLCYDIPSFTVQARGWTNVLPDLGDLLRLQNELDEITKDASSYITLRQRMLDMSDSIADLYMCERTSALPSQDRADLRGVNSCLGHLFHAIALLDFAAKDAVDRMQVANQVLLLQLEPLPSSPHRSCSLKALGDLYAAITSGHAGRYKISLSEGWSNTRDRILFVLDKYIRRGIYAADLADYLADVVVSVQQSIEKEKTQRENINASRMKLVGFFASLLPSTLYRRIQQLVLTEPISLEGITDLSPVVLESLARVSQLVRKLQVIKIKAEELKMKVVSVPGCASIASHVEAQRGLLETAQKASHAVIELFDLENRKQREKEQERMVRILDIKPQAKEENLDQ